MKEQTERMIYIILGALLVFGLFFSIIFLSEPSFKEECIKQNMSYVFVEDMEFCGDLSQIAILINAVKNNHIDPMLDYNGGLIWQNYTTTNYTCKGITGGKNEVCL